MARIIIVSVVFLLTELAFGSEPNLRFAKTFQIPGSSELVVVAEGDFEPRGFGSYSLRKYAGTAKKFPVDDFVLGVVRPRHGIVEAVRFDDIDDDGKPEIIVIIRSVGSGGYLSADAFRYRARSLELTVSVSDLDKGENPIRALRDKLKATAERNSSNASEKLQSSDLFSDKFILGPLGLLMQTRRNI